MSGQSVSASYITSEVHWCLIKEGKHPLMFILLRVSPMWVLRFLPHAFFVFVVSGYWPVCDLSIVCICVWYIVLFLSVVCVWSGPMCVPSKGLWSVLVDQHRKHGRGSNEGFFTRILSSFQGRRLLSWPSWPKIVNNTQISIYQAIATSCFQCLWGMYCLRVLLTCLLLTANDYKIGTEIGLHTYKQTDRHTQAHTIF